MKKQKLTGIGLCLDHAEAKMIEPGKSASEIKVIHSTLKPRLRVAGEGADGTRLGNYRSTNNESHKHFREQNEIHLYYKELAGQLLPFDEILIFGPTTAPNEFHNYLQGEKAFTNKKIMVVPTDYMTENQLVKFVNDRFE